MSLLVSRVPTNIFLTLTTILCRLHILRVWLMLSPCRDLWPAEYSRCGPHSEDSCKKCADCESSARRANWEVWKARWGGGGVGHKGSVSSRHTQRSLQPDPLRGASENKLHLSGWSHRSQGAGSVSIRANSAPIAKAIPLKSVGKPTGMEGKDPRGCEQSLGTDQRKPPTGLTRERKLEGKYRHWSVHDSVVRNARQTEGREETAWNTQTRVCTSAHWDLFTYHISSIVTFWAMDSSQEFTSTKTAKCHIMQIMVVNTHKCQLASARTQNREWSLSGIQCTGIWKYW